MTQQKWTSEDIPDQSGRVVVITGANSGIGYQEALTLARKGAKIVLAGRDLNKIKIAINHLLNDVSYAELDYVNLDLADLDSVFRCAEEIQNKYERLDLLINNAGVMIPPFSRTKQGFELQFGTNHLGHYALTGKLLPLILKTPNSRIVSMTSLAGVFGSINFSDLNYNQGRRYRKMLAYGQSKLANIMFINELANRLHRSGTNVIAVVAHPGGSATNLQNNGNFFFRRILTPLTSHPVSEAALPILRAACDTKIKNGSFWAPSGVLQLTGSPVEVKMPAKATNKSQCNQLWSISEKLTNVSYDEFLLG